MGLYYAAPLLGPSIGPLIGGAATSLFSWRATFYFLAIFGGVALIAFVFFKDTFRQQRSLSYQTALRGALRARESDKKSGDMPSKATGEKSEGSTIVDAEDQSGSQKEDMKLTLREMHIIRPIFQVSRRINNLCILFASGRYTFCCCGFTYLRLNNHYLGLIYGGITYCLSYTSVKTFGGPPYNYGSLFLGLVLLSFGVGASRSFFQKRFMQIETCREHVRKSARRSVV